MHLEKEEKFICARKANQSNLPLAVVEECMLIAKEKNKYPYKVMDPQFQQLCINCNVDVSLSKLEIKTAIWLGPKRTAACREAYLPNMRQDSREKESFIEINGICGELAFGKLYNWYPYETFPIEARHARKDRGDYRDGEIVIDIQTTEHPTGKLLLRGWKKDHRNGILALMTGDYRVVNNFIYRGCMVVVELKKQKYYRKPLPGKDKCGYWAYQSELSSLDYCKESFVGDTILVE